VTWANAFPAGATKDGEVEVIRFPVAAERNQEDFSDRSRRVFAGLGTEEEERAWFKANGPYVPSLVEHLRTDGGAFDLVIFFSYRYYPAFFGLPHVASRSVLVPTAEEACFVTSSPCPRESSTTPSKNGNSSALWLGVRSPHPR
jgi:hypothetical protein